MKALLAALLLPTAIFARIGETPAQCVARYGPAIKVDKETMSTYHKKAGLLVVCEFFEGKCDAIRFMKEADDFGARPEFSDAEREALMTANSNGKAWTKSEKIVQLGTEMWTCEGLRAFNVKIMDCFLHISTEGNIDRTNAAKAKEEKEKLKDF